MIIGYLHITTGSGRENGITRYGRTLAAQVRERDKVEVREADLVLDEEPGHLADRIASAAARLDGADLVHLQFSKYSWFPTSAPEDTLQKFSASLRAPLVVTLHDVLKDIYTRHPGLRAVGTMARRGLRRPHQLPQHIRVQTARFREAVSDRKVLAGLFERTRGVCLFTAADKARIRHLLPDRPTAIIPHWIEPRAVGLTPEAARQSLGLAPDRRWLVLQGFVYFNKGHSLLVRALSHLPAEVQVIFAGQAAPGCEGFLSDLEKLAAKLGVRDRLRITGYLSDPVMDQYLMAAHLGVCPFFDLSASGSLSTWIGAGRPVLAADLPQIREYNDRAPGAIRLYRPQTPQALARAILAALAKPDTAQISALKALQSHFGMPGWVDAHLQVYQAALRKG